MADILLPAAAAAPLRAFHWWLAAEEARQGRPLARGDLALDKVYAWAPNLKIVEHDNDTRGFRVRLFGTELVEIYGRDLTGQVLDDVLPARSKDVLLEGYRQAVEGSVTYERIAFA